MDIFHLVYLEPINYLYVLLISSVPLVLVEIQKLIKRFYLKHKKYFIFKKIIGFKRVFNKISNLFIFK